MWKRNTWERWGLVKGSCCTLVGITGGLGCCVKNEGWTCDVKPPEFTRGWVGTLEEVPKGWDSIGGCASTPGWCPCGNILTGGWDECWYWGKLCSGAVCSCMALGFGGGLWTIGSTASGCGNDSLRWEDCANELEGCWLLAICICEFDRPGLVY